MKQVMPALALMLLVAAAEAQTVVLEKPKSHGGFPCYAFSPDGALVAGGTGVVTMTIAGRRSGIDGGEVILWDAKTGKIRRTLGKHEASVRWLAWSAEGVVLASGSIDDGVVKLWDGRSGATRATLKGAGLLGRSGNGTEVLCALAPDGRALAMVTVTNSKVGTSEVRTGDTLTLWDLASGRARWQVPDSQVAALAFSPDGKALVASAVKVDWKESAGGATGAHVDPRLIAWETASGKERWRTPVKRGSPDSLAFVPGAGLLAIRGRLFTSIDAATGVAGAEIKGAGSGGLRGVTFSRDGARFVASRFMGDAIEWGQTATGVITATQEFNPDRLGNAAFSPDLKRAVGERNFTPQIILLAPAAK